MKYINVKKCLGLLSSGVVLLSGCGSTNSNTVTTNSTTTQVVTTKTETTTSVVTDATTIEKTTTEATTIETEIVTTTDKPLDKDEVIKDYCKSVTDNVKKYVNKDNFETVKDKTIDSLIMFTDFIFYDTEIKGITFDELKDETKDIIIDSFVEMDQLIMKKFPNYKEVFIEKTGYAYDVIIEKVNELKEMGKEKIISKVGEEKYSEYLDKYNRVKEEYHEVMDDTKKDVGEVKEKIKKWYENKTGK